MIKSLRSSFTAFHRPSPVPAGGILPQILSLFRSISFS